MADGQLYPFEKMMELSSGPVAQEKVSDALTPFEPQDGLERLN
jgi:hypothetical protein